MRAVDGELMRYLSSCRIDGIDAQEYLQKQIHRLTSTLDWIPPLPSGAHVLEIGAPPYLMSLALLKRYRIELSTLSFPFDYGVQPQERQGLRRAILPDNRAIEIPFHYVNVETESFPFPDGHFHLVLCCEVLEHLARDPMAMLAESNRVVADDGWLLLTTPNVARAASVGAIRLGRSPYVWSQYSQYGVYGRHNHEFAAPEIKELFEAAGFAVRRLETMSFFERPTIEPARFRGDTTFALANKTGPVRDRLPPRFYDYSGWHEHRIELLPRRWELAGLKVPLRIENRGGVTWQPEDVEIGLQLWQPHNVLVNLEVKRFRLPHPVAPHQSVELELEIPPLSDRRTYYRLDLVKSGEFWFEWRGSRPVEILWDDLGV